MTVQTEYLAAGHAVTDEVVTCAVATVVDAVTYYAGYLQELPGDQMFGTLEDTYGAWTAASQGGTRFTVVKGGVPGANEACVDKSTGRVLCTVQDQVLYFRYMGYRKLFGWWERAVHVSYPGLLESVSADRVIYKELMRLGGGFAEASFWVANGPSGGAVTLRIDAGAGGGETVTIADGAQVGSSQFTNRLKYQPGEYLTVSVVQAALAGMPTGLHGVIVPG